jgi:two-component system response regulator GlrR
VLTQRILVVEDEPDILIILEWALKKGAYDVTTARGARAALRALEREHFDLILTDLAMPGASGIELIELVRAMPGKERIPIVAVTAHGWDQLALEARNAGIDGFIQKPVDGKILRREVEKYLRGWRFAEGFQVPE